MGKEREGGSDRARGVGGRERGRKERRECGRKGWDGSPPIISGWKLANIVLDCPVRLLWAAATVFVAASSRRWGQWCPQQSPAHREHAWRLLGASDQHRRSRRAGCTWRRLARRRERWRVFRRSWGECQSAGAAEAPKPGVWRRCLSCGFRWLGVRRGWRLGRTVAVRAEQPC